MTKPLFLPASVEIEKTAYASKLDQEPSEWPTGILKEAYKQLPYLHRYEADVELDRVDPARGYAVGKLLVYPARMKKQAASTQDRLVSFPVIVREKELAPLDVYSHKDSMHPEDEESLHEVLFRPDLFEGHATPGQFSPVGLSSQLDPPDMMKSRGGGMKTASVGLWKAASPTFQSADVEDFKKDLRDNAPLRQAFLTTPSLKAALEDLVMHKEASATGIDARRREALVPTAIQIVEHGIGYAVKTASHEAFAPEVQQITRFEAQDLLSEDSFKLLQESGSLTLCVDPLIKTAASASTPQYAQRMGIYSTYSGAEEVEGMVVPHLIDVDGKSLGMGLFTGSGRHSMQEKIAGVFKRDVTIPESEPHGPGVFVYQEGPMAFALEPIEITNRTYVQDGAEKVAQYHGKRMSYGTPVVLTVVPGLLKVASVGNEIAIPDSFRFLPLQGKQSGVSVHPEDVSLFEIRKTAGASSVQLLSDGSCFSLRGSNADILGVELCGKDDTAFALAALGVAGNQAEVFLKKASERGSVTIPQTRRVYPEEEGKERIRVLLEEKLPNVDHLRVDLTKEASVIVDRETVDSILSLRFVTPENVSVYVNYLPELEKVSSKLAELLVASRLGMDDVKESAAKNAMTQVNSVVRGLEALQSRTQ